MDKNILLILIIFYCVARCLYLASNNKEFRHLILGFVFISIPFNINVTITKILAGTQVGTLGTILVIYTPVLLSLLVLLFFYKKKRHYLIGQDRWVHYIFFLLFFSLVLNPNNNSKFTTIIFVSTFLSYIILFYRLFAVLSNEEIVNGLYEGITFLCCLQFVLAIMFPVLNQSFVTKLFHEGAEEWSTRLGTRTGAVGVFQHPGNLALFIMLASSFLLSCYYLNFLKSKTLFLISINTITLFLTYSRTSYLGYCITLFAIYFVYTNRNKKNFFVATIFKFVIPAIIFVIWLIYYSPFSDIFLKTDADEQVSARLIHFVMAMKAFTYSPIYGVGLNTHLDFFERHGYLIRGLTNINFFTENPIHNIHLIILVETGLIGFIPWIYLIFNSVAKSVRAIRITDNLHINIMILAFIGMVISISFYGMTGWGPLSDTIFPYTLFCFFFGIKFLKAANNSNTITA